MLRVVQALVCLIGAATLCEADTIIFMGAPTGVNDGSYYVTPYEISINGTDQLVTCYDFFDDVRNGDVWQASLLGINAAASSGFFGSSTTLARYERVAWLSAQSYANAAQEIGLQHAIWNVFGAPYSPADTTASLAYENAANAAAASGYAGFDFSSFRFIQENGATAGASGVEQAFVFRESSGLPGSSQAIATPEPGAVWSCAAGLLIMIPVVAAKRRRRAEARRRGRSHKH